MIGPSFCSGAFLDELFFCDQLYQEGHVPHLIVSLHAFGDALPPRNVEQNL